MNLAEVLAIASEASESEEICEALWKAAHSDCRRVVVNALWVMTHLSDSKAKWLLRQQEELVRMLLSSTDTAVRRLYSRFFGSKILMVRKNILSHFLNSVSQRSTLRLSLTL